MDTYAAARMRRFNYYYFFFLQYSFLLSRLQSKRIFLYTYIYTRRPPPIRIVLIKLSCSERRDTKRVPSSAHTIYRVCESSRLTKLFPLNCSDTHINSMFFRSVTFIFIHTHMSNDDEVLHACNEYIDTITNVYIMYVIILLYV